jgi:hypothetical protein
MFSPVASLLAAEIDRQAKNGGDSVAAGFSLRLSERTRKGCGYAGTQWCGTGWLLQTLTYVLSPDMLPSTHDSRINQAAAAQLAVE